MIDFLTQKWTALVLPVTTGSAGVIGTVTSQSPLAMTAMIVGVIGTIVAIVCNIYRTFIKKD